MNDVTIKSFYELVAELEAQIAARRAELAGAKGELTRFGFETQSRWEIDRLQKAKALLLGEL